MIEIDESHKYKYSYHDDDISADIDRPRPSCIEHRRRECCINIMGEYQVLACQICYNQESDAYDDTEVSLVFSDQRHKVNPVLTC